MFALDRLKVVMPLEHVTVLSESVLTVTISNGEILKMNYSQKVPALLNIKIDHENCEAVIEFTGKILGERYKELIRLTNIKQCIDNINALRIVKINRKEFIHADVLKCDPTIDVESDDIPALTKYIKNSIDNYDLYSSQQKRNGNFVLSKNVDTDKCKRRLTIYNKEREMRMAKNKQFLQLYFNGQNPFAGICRFEMNLSSKDAIRKVMNIENPTVWNVLLSARIINPIRDFLDDILANGMCLNHHKQLYFYTTVYGTKAFQDNPTIIEHHKKYPMDRYAPAWKTVELMTIGNIQALYNNLKKPDVQADIALHYGVAKIGIFQSYFETIRKARNMCAHGNVLFDTKLPQRLPHGPAGNLAQPNNSNIIGIIAVIKYFIKQISIHRHQEMCDEIEDLLKKVKNEKVREILENVSGFETF